MIQEQQKNYKKMEEKIYLWMGTISLIIISIFIYIFLGIIGIKTMFFFLLIFIIPSYLLFGWLSLGSWERAIYSLVSGISMIPLMVFLIGGYFNLSLVTSSIISALALSAIGLIKIFLKK